MYSTKAPSVVCTNVAVMCLCVCVVVGDGGGLEIDIYRSHIKMPLLNIQLQVKGFVRLIRNDNKGYKACKPTL